MPTESSLLIGDSLSVQAMGRTLQRRDFHNVLQALATDAAGSPDAMDLTDVYRNAFADKAEGLVRLSDLQCGLSVCGGVVRAKGHEAYAKWLDRTQAEGQPATYAFAAMPVQLGADGVEYRFIFSTDPAANSMTARF